MRMSANTVAPDDSGKPFSSTSATSGFAEAGVPPGLERLTDPVALRMCLDAVAVVLPGTTTLIDYAYFENRPALVISITSTNGIWTLVAGPSCGINGPDEKFRTPLQ
jgi:hypothetical protein